ncbi:translation initiation factor IF-2 N-terminal domain-containing protein [Mycolicibacterium smegmatis]|uniref:translation initiation factor IF-2 N-terminal domain-containing protein n=1 Tax=Mycolicibacterium smegmatis TaxID=1772 RepID=UPI0005D7E323|nr:translation initiation factor IF-2 N-terminal domain-containing protein [Mycolicibacterium smegmatis]CKI18755.1 ribonuclease%2C Rne/Rng family [Mycolicibacterium smegmatis]
MAEDAHTEDLSTQTPQQEGLPERLRVHSLARVLGTTSRRVLDALAEFDGRQRSAHSTVDKADAERVRAALTESPAAETPPKKRPQQKRPRRRRPWPIWSWCKPSRSRS